MKLKMRCILLVTILLGAFLTSFAQQTRKSDLLVMFRDTVTGEYGYRNLKGDIIIPSGKYLVCFTDTFRTFAIVTYPHKGFVAIDRRENILYEVFPFDNGPDYSSGGLFRILVNNRIGYADSSTGKIVIKPQFECAWPFENGVAKVSMDCKTLADGEHSIWASNSWYYIDKTGRKVNRGRAN